MDLSLPNSSQMTQKKCILVFSMMKGCPWNDHSRCVSARKASNSKLMHEDTLPFEFFAFTILKNACV